MPRARNRELRFRMRRILTISPKERERRKQALKLLNRLRSRMKRKCKKMRRSIAGKLHTKVKQSKIKTQTSKPKIELSVGMTLEMLKALLGGRTPEKDTKSLYVVDRVNPFNVFPALPEDLEAKWVGKILWHPSFGRRPGKLMCPVLMDPLKVHFKKKRNLLTIKPRSKDAKLLLNKVNNNVDT